MDNDLYMIIHCSKLNSIKLYKNEIVYFVDLAPELFVINHKIQVQSIEFCPSKVSSTLSFNI